jgi:hypothetical protein
MPLHARQRGKARRWATTIVACLVACTQSTACGMSDSAGGARSRLVQGVSAPKVLLTPDLSAGHAGWCLVLVESDGSGCASPPTWTGPIVAENCAEAEAAGREYVYAVTRTNAISVGIAGTTQRTRPQRSGGMPLGFRTVLVELPRDAPGIRRNGTGCPILTAYSAQGDPIGRGVAAAPLSVAVAGQSGRKNLVPTRLACMPRIAPVKSFTVIRAQGLTHVSPVRGLIGDAFLSCEEIEYATRNGRMDVAVLLGARSPQSLAPNLPLSRAVGRHRGQVRFPTARGVAVAQRVGTGWLVVTEAGASLAEELRFLERVRGATH